MKFRNLSHVAVLFVLMTTVATATANSPPSEKRARPVETPVETPAESTTSPSIPGTPTHEAVAREAARSRALEDGWPDTPVGLIASGWVEAFWTGEDAMRKFLLDNVTEESLAERSMRDRIASYRKLRKRYGSLMLGSVVASSPNELTVILFAEDSSRHPFRFEMEEKDPQKLALVAIIQHGQGHRRPH